MDNWGGSVSQNIRADSTLDGRPQGRLAEPDGALAAGYEDYGRSGAVLEFVYLRLDLYREVFLDVDNCVVVIFAGKLLSLIHI